jgi:hypothetical protein
MTSRRSEAHDPTYCACAVCCDRHDRTLIDAQEVERHAAFVRVFEAIDAGGIELARSLYGGSDAEPC